MNLQSELDKLKEVFMCSAGEFYKFILQIINDRIISWLRVVHWMLN